MSSISGPSSQEIDDRLALARRSKANQEKQHTASKEEQFQSLLRPKPPISHRKRKIAWVQHAVRYNLYICRILSRILLDNRSYLSLIAASSEENPRVEATSSHRKKVVYGPDVKRSAIEKTDATVLYLFDLLSQLAKIRISRN